MKTALVLSVLLYLGAAADDSLSGKALFFPKISANSYVKLTPLKPLSLDAFTLCMSLSVDPDVTNQPNRETILFAYRTQNYDELNVWQEKGKISFYLSSSDIAPFYSLPVLTAFRTNLCLTWESSTGLAAFWVDGRRSAVQVYRQGHRVQSGGTVLLGQDADSLLGGFEEKQSFVGEITDVNMWDSVLSGNQIRRVSEEKWVELSPNVLNWNTVQYGVQGNVIVVPQKYY